jgi:hypothetical protein
MPLIGVAVILALSLTLPTLAAKAQETAGRPERLPGLAAEILSTRPEVLVTAGSEAILTLKRADQVIE